MFVNFEKGTPCICIFLKQKGFKPLLKIYLHFTKQFTPWKLFLVKRTIHRDVYDKNAAVAVGSPFLYTSKLLRSPPSEQKPYYNISSKILREDEHLPNCHTVTKNSTIPLPDLRSSAGSDFFPPFLIED